MHSKYDNMHKNAFYALICINKHVITIINDILLTSSYKLPFHLVVNPKNLCSIVSSISLFEDDHHYDIWSEIPPNIGECTGREYVTTVSKLRNEKYLTDPYEISVEKNPQMGVDNDLKDEK